MDASFPLDLSGTVAEGFSFTHETIAHEKLWRAVVPVARIDDALSAVRERARGGPFGAMIHSDWRPDGFENLQRWLGDEAMEEWQEPAVATVLERRRARLEARATWMHDVLRDGNLSESAPTRALEQSPAAVAKALALATPWIDPEELRGARTRAQRQEEDRQMGLEPPEPSILVFSAAAEALLLQYMVPGGNLQPDFEEFSPVFASWRARFGVTLEEYWGEDLALHVERPPVDLEQARAMALEFYLMCPGSRIGLPLTADTPEYRLWHVMSNLWVCRWFEE